MQIGDNIYFEIFHSKYVFFFLCIIGCSQHTVRDGSLQLQGPHPIGKCNYTQKLYQDVRNAWQTT